MYQNKTLENSLNSSKFHTGFSRHVIGYVSWDIRLDVQLRKNKPEMNKKRIALYLSGILLLYVVLGMTFHKNSQARTRSIASVVEVIPYFEPPVATTQQKVKDEVSVSCLDVQEIIKPISETSQVVRIKFNNCEGYLTKKKALFKVKNLSNGYDGQVFKPAPKVKSRSPASASTPLSTDYIQLQGGENIIELEISLNDGQKIHKKIKIIRQ